MAILSREITIHPAILRIPALLVELGVTAVGLIIAIDWLGTTRSWWSAVPKLDEYLAWALLADVLLAFVLAWRFERRRWVRIASVIFHTTLILLVIFIVVAMHFDLFPD
jgi:hypothetical protein